MNEDFDATVARGTFEGIKNAPGLGSVVTSSQGDGVIIDEIEVGSQKKFTMVPYNDPTGESIDVDATSGAGTAPIEKIEREKLNKETLQKHIDALEVRIGDRESRRGLVPDRDATDYDIHIDHLKTAKRVLEQLRDQV